MRLTDIFETVRPSILYHGTSSDNACKIIYNNVLLANTEHIATYDRSDFRPKEINKYGKVKGISLSRNPFFAKRWTSGQGVVLAFDAYKLHQRYRFIPIAYAGKRTEAEEFMIGELKPVDQYLTAVIVSRATFNELEDENENFIEGHEPYTEITKHPLLRIEGDAWDAMTGKNV